MKRKRTPFGGGGRKSSKAADLYLRRMAEGVEWLDEQPTDVQQKASVLRASPSVVAIVSPDIPSDMGTYHRDFARRRNKSERQVFMGSGTIIECRAHGDAKFVATILTAANLFARTDGVKPEEIKVEVYLPDGNLCKGEVMACDFHYNLAAVRILSETQLEIANLRDLDDIISMDYRKNIMSTCQDEQLRLENSRPFQLCPHSSLFKIRPKDMVTALGRWPSGYLSICASSFSVGYPDLDYKELYPLDTDCDEGDIGGPAINCHGEVVGIMVADKYFLPSNIVSRWWKYYKQNRKFCRPWLGVKVVNFHIASSHFLEPFIRKFRNASSGVIVTKVVENSPAYCAGLRSQDVIVTCDGESVQSTLEFFGKTWDKAGASVELSVLSISRGKSLNLTVKVDDETTQEHFYQWPVPKGRLRPGSDSQRPRLVFESYFDSE